MFKTGTTFAYRWKNIRYKKGWKNLLVALKVHFFKKIFYGVYFGLEALLKLRKDIMLASSSIPVGWRNILLSHYEKCLCQYFMLFLVISALEAK